MTEQNIKIETHGALQTRVFIDGNEIHNLRALNYICAVDEMPTLSLTFNVTEIDVYGDGVEIKKGGNE